jgi:hypothetical protein
MHRPMQIQQRAHQDMLRRACVFASAVICESHCAFRCVWGAKHHHIIFNVQVGPAHIQQEVC